MPLTIPPYSSQPPAVQAWIGWTLGPTIPPTPAVLAHLHRLVDKGQPNNPWTAAKASARNHFGALPWLYLYRWDGLTAHQVLGLERFLIEEHRWRGLGSGTPSPVAVAHEVVLAETGWEVGAPILNKDGKPVPVTIADAQHFTLSTHLALAMISRDPLAVAQTMDLLAWAHHWSLSPAGVNEDNPRAWGWVLHAAADVEAARLALGIAHEKRARDILDGGVDVVSQTHEVAKREFLKHGRPQHSAGLQLNPKGRHQKDHGFARRCVWMHALLGDAFARDATLPTGSPWATGMAAIARDSLLWVHDLARADGAPLGGLWDDIDPEPGLDRPPPAPGATMLYKPLRHRVGAWYGTMSATCILTFLRRPDDHHIARAMYDAGNRYRFSTHVTPDVHSAGLAIRAAGVLGYWR